MRTARQEHIQTPPLDSETPSDTDHKNPRPSMLYNVLPTVVQSHLPKLPSIRRSINELRGGRIPHMKSLSTSSSTDTDISAPETPPPTYRFRRGSGSDTQSRDSMVSTDTEEIGFRDDISERPVSSSMYNPPPFAVSETVTGISWKYANQGISLLTQAYQESSSLSRDADESNADLTRQLYLHGMTYLLRGLPSELTTEERLSLSAAIPGSIANLTNDPTTHALVHRSYQAEVAREAASQPPSVLHRITATIVFQMFVLFQFLLPYIKLFIGQAYRFERDHNVTQRLVNQGIMTVDQLGRRSLQLSKTVCQMNNGKVGQAIHDMTIWWVRGLTGGIQQGISEGVVVIGNEKSPNGKSRRVEKAE
ncbi:hypothetical protein K504DRAFT_472363 [Pleomassaria siparia CBS 279.74]|uniref:Uncharacterized protein n=1 Tax=Pleomassaria siparia CBS 279.74 TaxID=1314801 RepID=A0A6G1JVI0_9PLEO|nr:hypothetical protein K504DRAFT_472363 [Pleomassaria siparia CBS 279.74]